MCIRDRHWKLSYLRAGGVSGIPSVAVKCVDIRRNTDVYKRQGPEDAQITVEMEPDTEYEVFIEQASTGKMKTCLLYTSLC